MNDGQAEQITRRCFVSGKVQGVWYRAKTQEKAKALGVTGWAKNLPDGRVEVLASGERDKVEALCAWLWQGPELAEVTAVDVQEEAWLVFERFAVK